MNVYKATKEGYGKPHITAGELVKLSSGAQIVVVDCSTTKKLYTSRYMAEEFSEEWMPTPEQANMQVVEAEIQRHKSRIAELEASLKEFRGE